MLDLMKTEDQAEAIERLHELRRARGVRIHELSRALRMSSGGLGVRIAMKTLTRELLSEIGRMLDAPPGWPDILPAKPFPRVPPRSPRSSSELTAVVGTLEEAHACEAERLSRAIEAGDTNAAFEAATRIAALMDLLMDAILDG